MRRFLVLLLMAFTALSSTAPSAPAKRFEGYVAGTATGKGHHFVVGDGLNLVFVDQQQSFTGYRVCWHRLKHPHHRCWLGETGRSGHKDRIFVPAPSHYGTYIVKWTVRHRRKATGLSITALATRLRGYEFTTPATAGRVAGAPLTSLAGSGKDLLLDE